MLSSMTISKVEGLGPAVGIGGKGSAAVVVAAGRGAVGVGIVASGSVCVPLLVE